MTIDELIAEMPKNGWFLGDSGHLRRMDGNVTCCPITCGLRGRQTRTAMVAGLVAESDLNMRPEDALRIIVAADNRQDKDEFDPALRARLLAAVGLKEPT